MKPVYSEATKDLTLLLSSGEFEKQKIVKKTRMPPALIAKDGDCEFYLDRVDPTNGKKIEVIENADSKMYHVKWGLEAYLLAQKQGMVDEKFDGKSNYIHSLTIKITDEVTEESS